MRIVRAPRPSHSAGPDCEHDPAVWSVDGVHHAECRLCGADLSREMEAASRRMAIAGRGCAYAVLGALVALAAVCAALIR